MGARGRTGERFLTSKLADGPVTLYGSVVLGMSFVGCPNRGTPVCLRCALGEACQLVCLYMCHSCLRRSSCPCGWTDEAKRRAVFEKEVKRRHDVFGTIRSGIAGARSE